jgi:predicted AAA+ superfamily ATPase
METISENDILGRLTFDNPWWSFTAETEIRFKHPPRRALFPVFARQVMKAGAGEVLVVAGPLRAGKTVLLRQMVAELIERGTPPANVCYAALTTPSYTRATLADLFRLFFDRHRHAPKSELYVFFDEAQYAKEWERELIDLAGAWPNARFVAAVSSAAPAISTGRAAGEGRLSVFVLPPLSFAEFLRFRESEQAIFGGDAARAGTTVKPSAIRALNEEFHRYVNFGGFPEGVMAKPAGAPAPAFIRDGVSDRVLHKDLASLSGVNDPQELNRLFGILAKNTAREVSMEELAPAAGIAKNTLRKYLDYLEGAFLIRRLPRVDLAGKRFRRQVAFKVHLTQPCLYTALFGPVHADDEQFPLLAETALVAQWLGADAVDNLAYASWKGGAVDLVYMGPSSKRPERAFEIDWRDDYANGVKRPAMLDRFVQGTNPAAGAFILTRETARPAAIGGRAVALVPLALYAYWLARDPTLAQFRSLGTEGRRAR